MVVAHTKTYNALQLVLIGFQTPHDEQCATNEGCDCGPDDKPHKMPIVVVTDTIAHPRAVVIHLEHAFFTCPAVVCPWWFVSIAGSAVPRSVCCLFVLDARSISRWVLLEVDGCGVEKKREVARLVLVPRTTMAAQILHLLALAYPVQWW